MDDERLTEIVASANAKLRELIAELDITMDEWLAALAYLTRVGKHDEFILLSDVNGLSVFVDERTHHGADGTTPSNVVGPFWLPDAPLLDSPATICREDEPGEPLVVCGVVRSIDGTPLHGAIVDVWQTSATGLYENEDPSQPELNLRGRVRVAADGSYSIRTVRPVSYEVPTAGPVGDLLGALGRHAWRPAHVHFKCEAPGYRPLTTMAFIAGDPWLDDDTIGAVKSSLVIEVAPGDDGIGRATFDIVLAPVA